jgi:hypothetical protein
VPTVLKSGSVILLETSGLVQVCNGIALPLPLPYDITVNEGGGVLIKKGIFYLNLASFGY